MFSQFFRHSIVYTIGTALSRGIHFLLLPLLTRYLSPAGYGLVDYLLVVGSFVAVTVALEIAQGMGRHLPEYRDDPGRFQLYSSTALWFSLAAYAAFVLLAFLFSHPLTLLLFSTNAPAGAESVLMVAAAAFGLNGIVNLVISELRWELRPLGSTLTSIVYASAVIIFTVVWVVFLDRGPSGVFLAQGCGALVAGAVGFWLTRHTFAFRFDMEALRHMLAFSTPLVFSSVGVILSHFADRIMIYRLLDLGSLGVYGVAFRISLVVTILMVGIRMALMPLTYTHYRAPETPGHLETLFRWTAAMSLLGFAVLSLAAPWIVSIMAPPAFDAAANLVPLLVVSALCWMLYSFFPGLGIAKKTTWTAIINIGGGLVNILLNALLIPSFGLAGAAAATLASAILVLAAVIVMSQKHYHVPHRWGSLAKASGVTVVTVSAVLLFPAGGYFYLSMAILVLCVLPVVFLSIGLIDRAEWPGLLRGS